MKNFPNPKKLAYKCLFEKFSKPLTNLAYKGLGQFFLDYVNLTLNGADDSLNDVSPMSLDSDMNDERHGGDWFTDNNDNLADDDFFALTLT